MSAKYHQCWNSVLLKQTPPSPECVSTLQSIQDTNNTLQDAPISAKDNAASILLQKDAEASTSPSVEPNNHTDPNTSKG